MLKLKAKIYQYTGLFLAHKEKLKYLESDEYLEALRIEVLSHADIYWIPFHSLALRSQWEANNGFIRFVDSREFQNPSFILKIRIWFSKLAKAFNYDLRNLK